MSILAIDYGRKNLGLAITFDRKVVHLLEPINYTRRRNAFSQLAVLSGEHQVEQIVVGLPLNPQGSLSKMAQEAYRFGERLGQGLGKKVLFQNETLTSQEARQRAITARISRKKRSQKEHSLAAQLILLDFLSEMRGPPRC